MVHIGGAARLAPRAPSRYSRPVDQIVAADIGGTHARFARAAIQRGRVIELGPAVTLRTADHSGFEAALDLACPDRPSGLAIAFAGPVSGDLLRLTNSDWELRPSALRARHVTIVNDFGAVAHAAANLDPSAFLHICGPDQPLPDQGVITVVGPGTGLGVAILVRRRAGYDVIETEGGHIGFAPADAAGRQIWDALHERFGRVSLERVVSGPALRNIAEALGYDASATDDAALWSAALEGADPPLAVALDHLSAALGSAAGDLALAQGAQAVVIAGGIGTRLGSRLSSSSFAEHFRAKGRFEPHMNKLPVKLLTHPEPGLYGAAAAFARDHG